MKTFKNLKNGQIITNPIDGEMEVRFWDYHGTGKKIMCFADGISIYNAKQFDPADWELKTE